MPNVVDLQQELVLQAERMNRAVRDRLKQERRVLARLEQGILAHPERLLDGFRMRCADRERRLQRAMDVGLERKQSTLRSMCERMEALNPMGVLARGYAAVSRGEETVTSAEQIKCGDRLTVRFSDGAVCVIAEEQKG